MPSRETQHDATWPYPAGHPDLAEIEALPAGVIPAHTIERWIARATVPETVILEVMTTVEAQLHELASALLESERTTVTTHLAVHNAQNSAREAHTHLTRIVEQQAAIHGREPAR